MYGSCDSVWFDCLPAAATAGHLPAAATAGITAKHQQAGTCCSYHAEVRHGYVWLSHMTSVLHPQRTEPLQY